MARAIALALALALLAATAWGAPTQTRSLFSSGGRAAGGGAVQISGNIGDVLVGPSLGGTTNVWSGFWAPNLQLPVAVDGQPKTAYSFYLASPRPNPARGSAAIEYGLPRALSGALDVYDLQGRHVKRLFEGRAKAGNYRASWNLTNESGQPVSSGIYLYRLNFGGSLSTTRKVAVFR